MGDWATGIEAIVLSGCVAGVLDISATGTLMRAQGMQFRKLLQFVASGALGPAAALEGGTRTAGIGLLLHFLIAATWSIIYYAASRSWPVLTERPMFCGILYGVTVHLVMTGVVVPLSRVLKRTFSMKAFLTQLVVHIVCVGLPIALVQSYSLR